MNTKECECSQDESCSECCDHEFDPNEGFYCINGCELHKSEC